MLHGEQSGFENAVFRVSGKIEKVREVEQTLRVVEKSVSEQSSEEQRFLALA